MRLPASASYGSGLFIATLRRNVSTTAASAQLIGSIPLVSLANFYENEFGQFLRATMPMCIALGCIGRCWANECVR
jgi:hypothetical protein